MVEDDSEFLLVEEVGELGEVGAAGVHEETSVVDACAAGARSCAKADHPEEGGQGPTCGEVFECGLELRRARYGDDAGSGFPGGDYAAVAEAVRAEGGRELEARRLKKHSGWSRRLKAAAAGRPLGLGPRQVRMGQTGC